MDCDIGADGGIRIGEMLERNSTITRIDLQKKARTNFDTATGFVSTFH